MERRRPSVSTLNKPHINILTHLPVQCLLLLYKDSFLWLVPHGVWNAQHNMREIQPHQHFESRGQIRRQSLPGSPGVRSGEVSLGSRVWPARLPAHSFASEPAAPIFRQNT